MAILIGKGDGIKYNNPMEIFMIGDDLLKGKMRNFLIKKKWIVEKAIIAYAKILPEPTKENTRKRNTHIMLDIRDKYFEFEGNQTKMELIKSAWKIGIDEYEYNDYSSRGDFVLEEIKKSDWQARPYYLPTRDTWKEPLPEGVIQQKLQLPAEAVERLREMGGSEGVPFTISRMGDRLVFKSGDKQFYECAAIGG